MKPGKIDDATRTLGQPIDWNPDMDGQCGALEISDRRVGTINRMHSAWELSDAERAAIAAGGRVILTVCGDVHPPVSLIVEAP